MLSLDDLATCLVHALESIRAQYAGNVVALEIEVPFLCDRLDGYRLPRLGDSEKVFLYGEAFVGRGVDSLCFMRVAFHTDEPIGLTVAEYGRSPSP